MQIAADFGITVPGYHLVEQLYSGSRTLVYRASRETDQYPVVIKFLKRDCPSFGELLQFRNQYSIAKNLRLPGVVEPYCLEPYRNSYALVMEDFGGISVREYIKNLGLSCCATPGNTEVAEAANGMQPGTSQKQATAISLPEFLSIALQLADILNGLHHNRVIHKDLKPANILINPNTKQVKLIDFSISSLLPRETQTIQPASGLEGTLAYLSPEQTGRMNRGIDYRSDFYSLGATFFELLTGQLPFSSKDPMELVHCHIAVQPPQVHSLNPKVPPILSEMVAKLMAKNAEDRYQSALGLKHDLEQCLTQWQATGQLARFPLGQRDISDRFLIPEHLYGREAEVLELLDAFNRVSEGNTELLLVAGFSGIGKTAVVNEVHKPIVRQRGYFIKGKYDQLQRNVPLSAFVQAFQNLIRQLLAESDAQLQRWQAKLLAALGENGQVMIDVIPELERIIGQQPAVPELSGGAAQNRFNLLFQKFVQVFTCSEHPLVIFLDDLQWADAASLKLLQLLMDDAGHLLILGAYRDNEVSPAHPALLTIDAIAKSGKMVNTVKLQPLTETDINQVVADTLNCRLSIAQPLTRLVYQKTKGNPFFTTQFLKALHQEGWITFEHEVGYWQCDIARVQALALTDDVVEFMAAQLQKLPARTQNILKLAACIGAKFDLHTLAIVAEISETTAADDLWQALQEGLILPTSEVYKFFGYGDSGNEPKLAEYLSTASTSPSAAYKFLHDRVQQAAYSLIPDHQKQETHLKIGQLLLSHTPPAEQEEKLFEIVNQLNVGKSLIVDPLQKIDLAQLNSKAGRKARGSTAHAAALEYFTTGIALLPQERWQTHYELTLALYEAAAEVAYLNGDFQQMAHFANVVLDHTKTLLDRVKVYEVQIQAAQAQAQPIEAVRLALQILQQLGVHFPEHPSQAEIGQALEGTLSLLAGRQPLDLIALPPMTDPHQLAVIGILAGMTASAYVAAPTLLPLVMLEQVKLSLQYGNSIFAPDGYCGCGIILCAIVGDIDYGYQFGKLALQLLEQLDIHQLKARTYGQVSCCISHWKEPLANTLPFLREGYQNGLETGNLEWSGICAALYLMHAWFSGQELSDLSREGAAFGTQFAHLRQETTCKQTGIFQQAILNLQGKSAEAWQLNGDAFNEAEMLPALQAAGNQTAPCYFHISKLVLSYLFGQTERAIAAATTVESYLGAATGMSLIPVFHTYDSLARLAVYEQASEIEQQHILQRVVANQEKLKTWSAFAPANQQHKLDLVEAERHRVLGHPIEAMDYYDRAITAAKENEYIQEEALANELAAKFYLALGKTRIAQLYVTEAYYGYARWGANAKVADLETRYPQLLAPILQQPTLPLSPTETIFTLNTGISSSTSSSGSAAALDLAAILKAVQALSSEIELEKLLSTLLQVVLETAGADKCVLMLLEDNQLRVHAIHATTSEMNIQAQGTTLLTPQSLESSLEVPIGLVNMVRRSLQSTVIINAIEHPQWMNDRYIQRQQPKSILCNPILQQGNLMGVLYLENNLATEAFTSDRIEILNILCTQAAISLENARLYQQSQTYTQQLEHSLKKLQASETRFQRLADNVPGMIYQLRIAADGTSSMPYVSSGCYHLYGVTAEEVIAGTQDIRSMEHSDDAAGINQAMSDAMQTLTPFIHEWRIILPTGNMKWVQARSQPEQQADGSILWDGVVIDISDRKQAEIQLRQNTEELEQTLQELSRSQLQVIQSEKMSSLGQMVAGVAHEINNPVNFIHGNLTHIDEYTQDLLNLVHLYQQHYPHPVPAIQDQLEAIELPFLAEDLTKVLQSMRVGTHRIREIVLSLRNFSRLDEAEVKDVNIHDGIDSTLTILHNRLKAKAERPEIQIIREYGNLPLVECYAGQLNQVFMNIISNAIDALEERDQHRSYREMEANPSSISIRTKLTSKNTIRIYICDNGAGIKEQVRKRLFDPFFTTKPVGKGTGLGLSISYQIVTEKHGGKLWCDSSPGHGTQFVIEIPLNH